MAAALAITGAMGVAPDDPMDARIRQVADSDAANDLGSWNVRQTADDTWSVSWQSPSRLPVTGDRPQIVTGEQPLGTPAEAADPRTVTVVVQSESAPDPAALDVALSGDRLDEPGSDLAEPAGAGQAAPAPATDAAAVDPGTPGNLPITSSDYTLPGIQLGGMPVKVEMVGHVVKPADSAASDSHPLVLFLHGRHEFCYQPKGGSGEGGAGDGWPCGKGLKPIPSQLGYDYAQRLLASQGYVTVSIAANGINAQDYRLADGGAQARQTLVRRHLDQWAKWAGDGTHKVDLSKVVLVGHSRGGEGVARAALTIPLSAPYKVAGQVLLAPTDFSRQTSPYVPTATVLPYCDGDVSDLQGQFFTDRARDLDSRDNSLKSSLMVMGANHNFFNTEWTPGISAAPSFDDWYGNSKAQCGTKHPDRLSAAEQRAVGKSYIAGAVRLMTQSDEAVLPLFDGSPVRVPSAGNADVRTHAIGAGRRLVRPGGSVGLTEPVSADTSICSGVNDSSGSLRICGRDSESYGTPHWPYRLEGVPAQNAFEMSWKRAGAQGGLALTSPLNLTSSPHLDLRTVVDPTFGNVRLRVRLHDTAGQTALVTPASGAVVPALPKGDGSLAKLWAQTVRIDTAAVTGIDLAKIDRIEFVGGSTDGRIWVLDAAATPAELPDVPATRAPIVELGSATVTEGNGTSPAVAKVPFTIRGTVTRPARFVVKGEDSGKRGTSSRLVVDIAPGQRTGFVRWAYQPNRNDDLAVRQVGLTAFGLSGSMPSDYLGTLKITDDDPAPKVTVTAPKTVREGGKVALKVKVSKATGYDLMVRVVPIAGKVSVPRARYHDLPKSFVEQVIYPAPNPEVRLHKKPFSMIDFVMSGRTAHTLRIPIARDGRREGREAITLKIVAGGKVLGTRTVYIQPSR